VGGFVNERTDEDSLEHIVTTAVWEDEESFESETELRSEGFKKICFNPQKIMKDLNIEIVRAVYRRSLVEKSEGSCLYRTVRASRSNSIWGFSAAAVKCW